MSLDIKSDKSGTTYFINDRKGQLLQLNVFSTANTLFLNITCENNLKIVATRVSLFSEMLENFNPTKHSQGFIRHSNLYLQETIETKKNPYHNFVVDITCSCGSEGKSIEYSINTSDLKSMLIHLNKIRMERIRKDKNDKRIFYCTDSVSRRVVREALKKMRDK
jgi:hypothetical protein